MIYTYLITFCTIIMNNIEIINKTERFVQKYMDNYDDSHNFNHALRVKNLAIKIAKSENMSEEEIFEITIAALVHDVSDHKYKSETSQENILKTFLKGLLIEEIVDRVVYLACNVSLSKEVNSITRNISYNLTKQLVVIRDADRIESLGAMGISRYYMYGIVNRNSNIQNIVENIEQRTNILIKSIKTTLGKKISEDKYKIVKIFIEDYYDTIHNYHNY